MKTLASLGALVLATTVSAKATCVGGERGNYFAVCPPTVDVPEQPKQRHEKAQNPAPVRHVAKRQKLQHRDPDEKAPAAAPPPALPPH